ncbi:MAG: hypothetical protein AAGD06_25490 [Acidobacteriota bacterium]
MHQLTPAGPQDEDKSLEINGVPDSVQSNHRNGPEIVAMVGGDGDVLAPETARETFERLRDEGRSRAEAGHLEDALELLERALVVACSIGDDSLVALATCNRAAVAIQLGQIDEHVADLRTILMRSYCAETSFAAAYGLSVAYEFRKMHKKALFYGRIARDRSLEAEQKDYLAKSYNQIAGGLSAESYFDEAISEYENALDLLADDQMAEVRAVTSINLAYCRLVLGQYGLAFSELIRCLRWFRKVGKGLYVAWPHLMLCYGYLELGRLRYAWRHAERALELAEKTGQKDAIKSALFLLAEVEKAAGDSAAAYDYYHQLQSRFYPDSAGLPAAVSVVGMTQLVNLRA